MCVDMPSVANSELTPEEQQKYSGPQADSADLLHPGFHWTIGSTGTGGLQAPGGAYLKGDYFDVATSPNELLPFFAHHANLDRRWGWGGRRGRRRQWAGGWEGGREAGRLLGGSRQGRGVCTS